jgi:hypothetical protein
MLHTRMHLGNQPQKLTEDATLLHNEKCIVTATAGTLALPILLENETSGQLFIGKGQLTIDTIVETSRGAIGKPLLRDLTPVHPFLMLGETGNLKENLKAANEAFDEFTHRRHNHIDIEPDARIFAFANEDEKWAFLIAKDDRLVYASKHKVYISRNGGERASIGPESILVNKKGKTVVIDRGNILVDRD